jgi:predicted transcriptional regulator/transcriptional regulator with XRE-family HTH domain
VSQVAAARAVGLSASYLNQIERDQRPLPREALRRLAEYFNVQIAVFDDSEEMRDASDLREVLADPMFSGITTLAESHAAVRSAPKVARGFLALYRAYQGLREEHRALQDRLVRDGAPPGAPAQLPYDEVRDWVQSRRNHFPALDEAAERLSEAESITQTSPADDLRRILRDRHGITTTMASGLPDSGLLWQLDREAGRLLLADDLPRARENFLVAHVLGLLGQGDAIAAEVDRAGLSSEEARALARVGLANYFAGALMLPYRRFRAEAEALRHDIERLQRRFGASFEQVCHRLSTLQRPGDEGVPFHFLKADIAGNVTKRSSATRFHFARFGGACPLWNVHQAFATPGRILVQVARMPDGIAYLCVARTVGEEAGSFLSRPRETAVLLGCELAYADRVVYAAGLNVHDPRVTVPIGPGCRTCERANCAHRAMPPVGRALNVGSGSRGVVPYRILPGGD